MGQALIRNIEDDLLDAYREAAKGSGRSLEAELREALKRARPLSSQSRKQLIEEAQRIAAMTPNVPQTPSEQLVREDRDGYRDP
jgi:antitoxin FitA